MMRSGVLLILMFVVFSSESHAEGSSSQRPAAPIAPAVPLSIFGAGINDSTLDADGFNGIIRYLQTLSIDQRTEWIMGLVGARGKAWTKQQKQNLLQNFLTNSDGSYSGAIFASSSAGRPPNGDDPGEPDYRAHWIRDSAIAADSLVTLLRLDDTTPIEREKFQKALSAFVRFSRRVQETPIAHEWAVFNANGEIRFVPAGTPGAIAVRYGEPKYRVTQVTLPDGRTEWRPAAFNEEWGRPQNDGPALRATTMSNVIRLLAGRQEKLRRKGQDLSPEDRGTLQTAVTVLREDLAYVVGRWRDPSFDLWEEVYGKHFFTLVVQSEALQNGIDALRRIGDTTEAERWGRERAAIETELNSFWDSNASHIRATRDIRGGMRKDTDIDMAIIMAALRRRGQRTFSPSDPKVLATAMELIRTFREDPAFLMNRIEGLPGVAMGRYPHDPWTGERRLTNPDGSPASAGHPWVITTLAMGQLFYEAAIEFEHAGRIEINPLNRAFFKDLLNGSFPPEWRERLDRGETVSITHDGNSAVFRNLVTRMRGRGTDFAARILASGIRGGDSTAEQFSGAPNATVRQIGAVGLTWNCAAYLAGLVRSSRQLGGLIHRWGP